MEQQKIKVLHIVKDDKFFDGVFNSFETISQFDNSAILPVPKVDGYVFQRIKNKEKVRLVTYEDVKSVLKEGFYNVIFFHSLPASQYKYFKFIPKDKIVIWWCFGFEIYHSAFGMKPLINVQLYKPQTALLINYKSKDINNLLIQIGKKLCASCFYNIRRKKVINRIDYFQPVIPLEYQLMKKVRGFHAKEFYFPNFITNYENLKIDYLKEIDGAILIGNSQSASNNHIDVWNATKEFIPEGREIIFPLNYIGDEDFVNVLIQRIESKNHSLRFLRDFMPKDEYFEMIEKCSYAIFGVIRQQAMGNIYYCISHGLKVFLYRDSMVYHFLKENGFVVYAIEDINKESFITPLTQEDMKKNLKAYKNQLTYVNDVWKKALEEIKFTVNN